jgi:UDP-glucuronate decarboxylase
MNLGNPVESTILELAEHIVASCNSKSAIVRKPLPADDPRRRRPDISRARATLGWEPKTPLAEGLARTIEYFDGLLRRSPVGVAS